MILKNLCNPLEAFISEYDVNSNKTPIAQGCQKVSPQAAIAYPTKVVHFAFWANHVHPV